MTNVTNNYNRSLGLPNGVVIASGESADVDGWDKLSKHKVVAKWLEAGVLSAGKSSKKDKPEVVENVQFTEEVDEDTAKEELIAQLAELGVKADKRSSVEKLQEKLDEALAK
jgi:hypothetical protein